MILYQNIKEDVVLCKLLGESSIYDDFCDFLHEYLNKSVLSKTENNHIMYDYRIYFSVYENNHITISSYIIAKWMAVYGFGMSELYTIIGAYLYETTGKTWKIL